MIQTLWGTEQLHQKEIDEKWHDRFKLQRGVEFIRHEFTNRKDFVTELEDFVQADCWAMYMDGQRIFDTLAKVEQEESDEDEEFESLEHEIFELAENVSSMNFSPNESTSISPNLGKSKVTSILNFEEVFPTFV